MPVNRAMKMPMGSDSTPSVRACTENSGIHVRTSRAARATPTTKRAPLPTGEISARVVRPIALTEPVIAAIR